MPIKQMPSDQTSTEQMPTESQSKVFCRTPLEQTAIESINLQLTRIATPSRSLRSHTERASVPVKQQAHFVDCTTAVGATGSQHDDIGVQIDSIIIDIVDSSVSPLIRASIDPDVEWYFNSNDEVDMLSDSSDDDSKFEAGDYVAKPTLSLGHIASVSRFRAFWENWESKHCRSSITPVNGSFECSGPMLLLEDFLADTPAALSCNLPPLFRSGSFVSRRRTV